MAVEAGAGDPVEPTSRSTRRRVLRWAVWGGAVVIVGLCVLCGVQLFRAAREAHRGEQALDAAVSIIDAQPNVDQLTPATLNRVRRPLLQAEADFDNMHRDLAGAGPMLFIGRGVPLLRVQIWALYDLSDAGQELAQGGVGLVTSASGFIQSGNAGTSLAHSNGLVELRSLQAATDASVVALDQAVAHLHSLNGYRLLGPIGQARGTLDRRLPHLEVRADSAQGALNAFVAFAGGDGPRRYLILTQDPGEVRPTGGFIGTYGVLSADDGRFQLDQFAPSSDFYQSHPNAVVPEANAPTVFRMVGTNQTLADINASPNWPADAQLAERLFEAGGGTPVDGVLSFTPDFLARMVTVLGPINVGDGYNETVTGANLVNLTNYWTHLAFTQPNGASNRKQFLVSLAPLVTQRLDAAPATEWPKLASAVAAGFDSQEAMLWSSDTTLDDVVHAHVWDFAPVPATGDFYDDSEFEYAAKNGYDLRRSFDHSVDISPNGSASVTTTMTLSDPDPEAFLINPDAELYVVPYGPVGAKLDPASTRPTYQDEPELDYHPGVGWLITAPPMGTASLKVVWDVPGLLKPLGHGRWSYSLLWVPSPSHQGDTLGLHFVLPPGWHWIGPAPPANVALTREWGGTWMLGR